MCQIFTKIKYVISHITIEPIVFMFGFTHGLYGIIVQSLYISKVCNVNFNYTEEICDNIYHHEEVQIQVQQYASQLQAYNYFLQGIPAVAYALFAGPWSDINGRKTLIIFSCCGYIFNNTVYLINTIYFHELKAEYLLFECLQDCTGGYATFFLACHSYMTDISSAKSRTKRMIFIDGVFPIGFLIGLGVSGIIKENLGFVYNFSFAIGSSTLSVLYTIFIIKESEHVKPTKPLEDEEIDPVNKKSGIMGIFRVKNLKTGLKATFRQRENNMRKFLLLLILAFILEMFLASGKGAVMFLYFRLKFKWDEIDFSKLMVTFGVLGIFTQYIVIPFLTERLKLKDTTIILMGVIGTLVQQLIFTFAIEEWLMYLAGVFAILGSCILTLLRSLVSKIVAADEIGKIFASMAACQAIIFMSATPIYSMIYKKTLAFFPGMIFVLNSCLYAIVGVLIIYILVGMKTNERRIHEKTDFEKKQTEKIDPLLKSDQIECTKV